MCLCFLLSSLWYIDWWWLLLFVDIIKIIKNVLSTVCKKKYVKSTVIFNLKSCHDIQPWWVVFCFCCCCCCFFGGVMCERVYFLLLFVCSDWCNKSYLPLYAKLFQNTCHTYETNKDALPYPGTQLWQPEFPVRAEKVKRVRRISLFIVLQKISTLPKTNLKHWWSWESVDLDTVQFKKTKTK